MDLLKRNLAPIPVEAWKLIDDEARRGLKLHLAGRKVVDFDGPRGWTYAAKSTGGLDLFEKEPVEGVSAGIRRVQPLVELRTPIRLSIMELDGVVRGAENPDLRAVVRAAERVARAEDAAIFGGYPAAKITGIIGASPHPKIAVATALDFPRRIVEAKDLLGNNGVDGPYALVLGTRAYEELYAATEDGYPIAKRIERSLVDKIVRATAIEGAVLLSMRGGDFELTVGQDLSLGYADRDRHEVELFLTETFTFRVLEPAAAVVLVR